jgi:hypothetical protein
MKAFSGKMVRIFVSFVDGPGYGFVAQGYGHVVPVPGEYMGKGRAPASSPGNDGT